MMERLVADDRLDEKLEGLLDRFESEVEPYDRLSRLSMFATPAGVLLSIFLPLALLNFSAPSNAISGSVLYWIVGGILATVGLAKIPLFYVDHKKHVISRTKYKPIAGVCMCDLSQLRFHLRRMEKAKTTGDRIRHAKLAGYYRHKMGWQPQH